jgi:uncharacterized protein (TIGR02466 family)
MNTAIKHSESTSTSDKEKAVQATIPVIREEYFPTCIYRVEFPDAETFNAYLLPVIRDIKANNTENFERSNIVQLGGWHSHNTLHKMSEFSEFVNRVHGTAEVIAEELTYDSDHDLKIVDMWSIINPPGGFNRNHIHSKSLWSGVYYVQAPKNSGTIQFTDPRTEHLMFPPKLNSKGPRNKKTWSTVQFEPRAGVMLLFPSWLYHSVNPNFTEATGEAADRVCLSFNLSQQTSVTG